MQKRLVVFLDRNAGCQQLAIERARRVVKQPVFDARLQKERDAHAALGRIDERVTKVGSGKKYPGGAQYSGAARADAGRIARFVAPPESRVARIRNLCLLRAAR